MTTLRKQVTTEEINNLFNNRKRNSDYSLCTLEVKNIDFSLCELPTDIENVKIKNCLFEDLRFKDKTVFKNCEIIDTKFINTDFHSLTFQDCKISNMDFYRTKKGGLTPKTGTNKLHFENSYLRGLLLKSEKLSELHFTSCEAPNHTDIINLIVESCVCGDVKITKCDLYYITLSDNNIAEFFIKKSFFKYSLFVSMGGELNYLSCSTTLFTASDFINTHYIDFIDSRKLDYSNPNDTYPTYHFDERCSIDNIDYPFEGMDISLIPKVRYYIRGVKVTQETYEKYHSLDGREQETYYLYLLNVKKFIEEYKDDEQMYNDAEVWLMLDNYELLKEKGEEYILS